MAKREKIILAVMAVVVMFGAYDLFFSSGAKKKPVVTATGVAETNKFIADVVVSLRDDFAETNMHIIQQARTDWGNDPFWQKKPQEEEAKTEVIVESKKEVKEEEKRIYTGYLEMGEQKLAIINGAEYELGDELGRGGPLVKSIDPKKVIIAIPETAEEIILPLKETR